MGSYFKNAYSQYVDPFGYRWHIYNNNWICRNCYNKIRYEIKNGRPTKKIPQKEKRCSYPSCSNPNKTFIRKDGFPLWLIYNDDWICWKCYYKIKLRQENENKKC